MQGCYYENIQEFYIDAGPSQLFCRTLGLGQPLVIIHGGPGLSHDYLLPNFEQLADHNFLIFYDQRGCGRSKGEINPDIVNSEEFVKDLETIRQTFHLKKMSILAIHGAAFWR